MRIVEGNLTPLENATQLHLNRTVNNINGYHELFLDQLIVGLKSDGIWDKIDVLCVAQTDESASLMNLKGDSAGAPDSLTRNSPTFTTRKGFLCEPTGSVATAKHMRGDVNEDACTLYAQFDGHRIAYIRTFDIAPGFDELIMQVDSTDSLIIANNPLSGTDTVSFVVQSTTPITLIHTADNPKGFFGESITANNARHCRVNDSPYSSSTVDASYSLQSVEIGIGATVGGLLCSVEQFFAWGWGSGLTPTELANYEDRIRTYAQALGADVY